MSEEENESKRTQIIYFSLLTLFENTDYHIIPFFDLLTSVVALKIDYYHRDRVET